MSSNSIVALHARAIMAFTHAQICVLKKNTGLHQLTAEELSWLLYLTGRLGGVCVWWGVGWVGCELGGVWAGWGVGWVGCGLGGV